MMLNFFLQWIKYLSEKMILYIGIIKTILYFFFFFNIFFYFIFFNIEFLIKIYNEVFIGFFDVFLYFFKNIFIKSYTLIFLEYFYDLKLYFLQRYYSLFEYNYMKKIFNNLYTYYQFPKNKFIHYQRNIYRYVYINILFPYFKFLQNTEYYSPFNVKQYHLDFIYNYQRKGECGLLIRDNLNEYIPDAKRFKNYKNTLKIKNHYNYLYTSKYLRREKCLANYNDLYLRRNFFIINHTNFLSNKELLYYQHDLHASCLDEMKMMIDSLTLGKLRLYNFRRKDASAELTSFENFLVADTNATIIDSGNELVENINNTDFKYDVQEEAKVLDYIRYKIFMKQLKIINSYDSLIMFGNLLDNFYITGTTEIYYLNKSDYLLINFLGLTDYFFYFFYYSFVEIPFFLEDLYINLNKNVNYLFLLKKIFLECFKINNFYVIFIFFYALYFSFRSLILNEYDLLYALLYFKRHLTFLIILGFIIKFNLDVLDPVSFELFLLLWIPGIINYIVYEEWWWIWWTDFEKVKYHFTFNYEGVLYCPINLYFIFIVTPVYFQTFLIFKLLVLHYLIFHLNRIDFKWKYIIKKNLFIYVYFFFIFLIYNSFFFKEELVLLKTRLKNFNINKYNNIFEINFNIYNRNFLLKIEQLFSFSLLILIKKYIQYFLYYFYFILLLLFLLIMLYKIFYNLSFIINILLLKDNFELLNFMKNNFRYSTYLKDNIIYFFFQEYQKNQRLNYYKYNIIHDYRNIDAFRNELSFKFQYPGLLYYRASREFNNSLYWLYFQGGHNFIGETHYKSTILDNFYKKNIPYFYKFFILDSPSHKRWTDQYDFRKAKLSENRKKFIYKRSISRIENQFYTLFIKNHNKNNKIIKNFNFITYKDLNFISLSSKNFYKTTSYYTNNKTSYYALYAYRYYYKNYILAMDDLDISEFIASEHHEARAWGTYHMGANFLAGYSRYIVKRGQSLTDFMIKEYKIKLPFKSIIRRRFSTDLSKIIFYNQFIPNRLDYIEYHKIFYQGVYQMYYKELEQCILDKDFIEQEIVEDNSISIFTLIFDYDEYRKQINERNFINSKINTRGTRIQDPRKRVKEYI